MKKIFLLSIFFCIFHNAQIKQVELRKCEQIGYAAEGAFDIINEKCNDGNYKFSFRDFNYQHITIGRTFEFKDIDGAYENLFNSIIKGFETPKEKIAFDLPNHLLVINYESALGIKGAVFNIQNKNAGENGRSNAFLRSDIYRLFGFKKPKK